MSMFFILDSGEETDHFHEESNHSHEDYIWMADSYLWFGMDGSAASVNLSPASIIILHDFLILSEKDMEHHETHLSDNNGNMATIHLEDEDEGERNLIFF